MILKELDIGHNEDNWNRWVSNFHMLVESLELKSFVFGEIEPTPMTFSELMKNFANGDADLFEKVVIPELFQDVLVRVYHRDFPGVEIINEEEKRRFDAAMVLLFSILTSCTTSERLEGIMDRGGARESKNVALMFRHLRDHFVQVTGTSLTQKMMKLVSIAHFNPKNKAIVKAIETIRECRRALAEQQVICPEVFL